MSILPATIAAERLVVQQNVALSAIKENADRVEAIANLLEESSRSAPINGTQGTRLNITT